MNILYANKTRTHTYQHSNFQPIHLSVYVYRCIFGFFAASGWKNYLILYYDNLCIRALPQVHGVTFAYKPLNQRALLVNVTKCPLGLGGPLIVMHLQRV